MLKKHERKEDPEVHASTIYRLDWLSTSVSCKAGSAVPCGECQICAAAAQAAHMLGSGATVGCAARWLILNLARAVGKA